MDTPNSFSISSSRQFAGWLSQERTALAFTTYQAGRLFFLGLNPSGGISAFERAFPRCMGLWTNGQTLWLSSLYEVWRLENTLDKNETVDGYDRLFVPQVGFVTSDIDVHDIAVGDDGQPVFVSTLFSCLATVSQQYSFAPLWKPSFISRLTPEDRCHLNGLAMKDGKPKYVTVCSQSDALEGWRAHRADGGCVIDVETDDVVCRQLSMPHSPRWHDEKLWLLDSGSGFLGFVDFDSSRFEPVAFCAGYARGLAFVGRYAIVGHSKCRRERTFAGLPLEASLRDRKVEASCGLSIVNTYTGNIEHWARIEGVVEELFDVAVLPNVVRPKAIGFKTDEICRTIWLEQDQQSQRWTAVREDIEPIAPE